MSAELQGILNQFGNSAEIRNAMTAYTVNSYINRCPLVTRLPRMPIGSTTFNIVKRNFRKRTAVVQAGFNTSATSISLDDASSFQNGDVLSTPEGERVEITADPVLTTTPNTITVRRSAEGTTAASGSTSDVLTLISNSRTGGEINQNGVAFNPIGTPQYCQVWQFPVQISGSLASSSAFVLPNGVPDISALVKAEANQNMIDDMEKSSFYGIGEAPAADILGTSANARPKQKGLNTLIVTNNTSTPTNAGAYKPTDLIRDTLQAARGNGGEPDILLLSMDWMGGLTTWGQPAQRIDAGTNIFGTPINVFECPFLVGVNLVFCFHLTAGTAAGTQAESLS